MRCFRIAFFLLGILTFFNCKTNQSEGIQLITTSEFEEISKIEGVQLVDVRTPNEFKEGHLPNALNIDFLDKKSEIVKITDFEEKKDNYAMVIENSKGDKKQIYYSNPKSKSVNSIIEEHNDFAKSIINKTSPQVSFKDGYKALKLAIEIIKKVNENS